VNLSICGSVVLERKKLHDTILILQLSPIEEDLALDLYNWTIGTVNETLNGLHGAIGTANETLNGLHRTIGTVNGTLNDLHGTILWCSTTLQGLYNFKFPLPKDDLYQV
jgi:hypothetical protein